MHGLTGHCCAVRPFELFASLKNAPTCEREWLSLTPAQNIVSLFTELQVSGSRKAIDESVLRGNLPKKDRRSGVAGAVRADADAAPLSL